MKTKKALTTKSMLKPRHNGRLGKSLPIAQIRDLYKDEWLAVRLTKVDRYDNPIAGVVVARAKTDEDLLRQAKEYEASNKDKPYIFFAGNYIPEGGGVVLAIKQSNCRTV